MIKDARRAHRIVCHELMPTRCEAAGFSCEPCAPVSAVSLPDRCGSFATERPRRVPSLFRHLEIQGSVPTYPTGSATLPRAVFPSARLLRRTRRYVRLCLTRDDVVSRMRQRRRRVFIDTHKGCVSAGFTVAAEADAADVSMRLRERGWIAYRLRLEAEQHAWVATVIDWARRAA